MNEHEFTIILTERASLVHGALRHVANNYRFYAARKKNAEGLQEKAA